MNEWPTSGPCFVPPGGLPFNNLLGLQSGLVQAILLPDMKEQEGFLQPLNGEKVTGLAVVFYFSVVTRDINLYHT